jgi:hypothetical protein
VDKGFEKYLFENLTFIFVGQYKFFSLPSFWKVNTSTRGLCIHLRLVSYLEFDFGIGYFISYGSNWVRMEANEVAHTLAKSVISLYLSLFCCNNYIHPRAV